MTIALCDIDHFKSINDTHGHNCGDEVLKTVARTLRTSLRPEDTVARWGGEEFLILFRDTDTRNSMIIAERLKKEISAITFSHDGEDFNTTLTIGIHTCTSADMTLDSCINMADTALYSGKQDGRNRISVSG